MSEFDYGPKRPDGQHSRHPVLPDGVPLKQVVRNTYKHTKCSGLTRMGSAIAETYAKDPGYYTRTFCVECRDYFPVSEFVWPEDGKPINKPIGIMPSNETSDLPSDPKGE